MADLLDISARRAPAARPTTLSPPPPRRQRRRRRGRKPPTTSPAAQSPRPLNRAERGGLSRAQFRSEMSKSALYPHLRQWRRICGPSYQDVLQIVEWGLRVELTGSPSLRRRSIGFRGSPEQKAHLRQCLAKWLADGVIEPASPHSLLMHLLFPVHKPGPKKFRWVSDLTYLNRFVARRRFSLTGIPAVREMIQPGDFLTSIDLSDAYHHVMLSPAHRHLFGFQADGRVFRFRVLVFGLSSAPWVFTRVIKPVLAFLHRQGIRVLSFLDDFLLAARTRQQSRLHTLLTVSTLRSLGLSPSDVKSELEPTPSLIFLGFRLDTVKWTIAIPLDKLRAIRADARQVLRHHHNQTLSIRRVASLVGKLVAAAPASQVAMARRLSLQRVVSFAVRRGARARQPPSMIWSSLVQLSATALRDCRWLAHGRLAQFACAPLRPPAQASATVTTDASGFGWGGFVTVPSPLPRRPPQILETRGLWSREDVSKSINWKEATAAALVFRAFRDQIVVPSVSSVTFRSDNSTTVSYLRRMGGRHRHLAEAVEPIFPTAARASRAPDGRARTGRAERTRRRALETVGVAPARVGTFPESDRPTGRRVGSVCDGLVRDSSVDQGAAVCVPVSRPESSGLRRVVDVVARDVDLPPLLTPLSPHREGGEKAGGRSGVGLADSASLANSSVLRHSFSATSGQASRAASLVALSASSSSCDEEQSLSSASSSPRLPPSLVDSSSSSLVLGGSSSSASSLDSDSEDEFELPPSARGRLPPPQTLVRVSSPRTLR
eukprot:TRINITY_DN385_c0_g1_i6.p1 TRINITY_DN385_c0_g1~~TRINITY_DN385_c0_g1_i6.p1  ORF type:complete len:775 (+),score=76.17 TRINITY_DN385_c0_g1_i6:1103-3427(+)